MSETQAALVEPRAPWWRSGKIVVAGIALSLLIGGYFYRETVPPAWLRAFGAEIALRAAADPSAPLPEDTREASPRGQADNPLICLARIATQSWDRAVFVTTAQAASLTDNPVLAAADWPGRDGARAQLSADDRYQLIILLRENAVIDTQVFFTFWADLSGIARAEGFTPETAVFTAESHAGHYVLNAAAASLDSCPKP
ncbi:MAG: hypothetical protein JNK21_00795 [Rhodospirillaceae bacterium]|nr:hypothetical protein [Rhodospirillaceae bacterium]